MCKKFKCSARAITIDDNIEKESGDHNHAGDGAKVEAARVQEKVREDALNSRDTPHYIVSCASMGVSGAVALKLPSISNIKRNIRNIRAKKNYVPALPDCQEDLIIPEDFTKTHKGELFLMYDSGPTNDRILIFSTQRNLDLLARSENWFADGTFKTVPSIFFQLYTIHGVHSGSIIPLVYALLPNKTQETYKRFLQIVKEKIPTFEPATIMIDFELAMIRAIEHEFPRTKCRGCFFHLCKSIYRKIQENGFKVRYDTDAEFAIQIRLLSALAFVPVFKVEETFEYLIENEVFPAELQSVVDSFEDTWIGRPHRNNRRRAPFFKHELWNCFDYAMEEMPKTNNAV
ncbi:uncharacterized protein, partial [Palaemon carinicauda]|uniref:uncharacterized protein n=1 Tax=Palaemon carinicauda TaxID=392227 RepID=UPI0035B57364